MYKPFLAVKCRFYTANAAQLHLQTFSKAHIGL